MEEALEIFPYLNCMLGVELLAVVELVEQQYLIVAD